MAARELFGVHRPYHHGVLPTTTGPSPLRRTVEPTAPSPTSRPWRVLETPATGPRRARRGGRHHAQSRNAAERSGLQLNQIHLTTGNPAEGHGQRGQARRRDAADANVEVTRPCRLVPRRRSEDHGEADVRIRAQGGLHRRQGHHRPILPRPCGMLPYRGRPSSPGVRFRPLPPVLVVVPHLELHDAGLPRRRRVDAWRGQASWLRLS